MAEYIEREASCKDCLHYEVCPLGLAIKGVTGTCLKFKNKADVVEARHGVWKFHRDGSGTCNQCGGTAKNVWDYDMWQNYCGRCGAKMDGKGEG